MAYCRTRWYITKHARNTPHNRQPLVRCSTVFFRLATKSTSKEQLNEKHSFLVAFHMVPMFSTDPLSRFDRLIEKAMIASGLASFLPGTLMGMFALFGFLLTLDVPGSWTCRRSDIGWKTWWMKWVVESCYWPYLDAQKKGTVYNHMTMKRIWWSRHFLGKSENNSEIANNCGRLTKYLYDSKVRIESHRRLK